MTVQSLALNQRRFAAGPTGERKPAWEMEKREPQKKKSSEELKTHYGFGCIGSRDHVHVGLNEMPRRATTVKRTTPDVSGLKDGHT